MTDAIISRCIARIDYDPPSVENQRKIWQVLDRINGTGLTEGQIGDIVLENDDLTGRDIKQLLKLASLWTGNQGGKVTPETIGFVRRFLPTKRVFRQNATERALGNGVVAERGPGMILDMSWSWLFRGDKRRLGRENQVRTVLDSVPLLEEVDGAVLVEKGGAYESYVLRLAWRRNPGFWHSENGAQTMSDRLKQDKPSVARNLTVLSMLLDDEEEVYLRLPILDETGSVVAFMLSFKVFHNRIPLEAYAAALADLGDGVACWVLRQGDGSVEVEIMSQIAKQEWEPEGGRTTGTCGGEMMVAVKEIYVCRKCRESGEKDGSDACQKCYTRAVLPVGGTILVKHPRAVERAYHEDDEIYMRLPIPRPGEEYDEERDSVLVNYADIGVVLLAFNVARAEYRGGADAKISRPDDESFVIEICAGRNLSLPTWLNDKLDSFMKLEANWNSYGAGPIAAPVVEDAKNIAQKGMFAGLGDPWVSPGGDGGIGIEWGRPNHCVMVDITPSKGATVSWGGGHENERAYTDEALAEAAIWFKGAVPAASE